MEQLPSPAPDWQKVQRLARTNQRWELGFVRVVGALLLPVGAHFYSPRLALLLAVPCGAVFV